MDICKSDDDIVLLVYDQIELYSHNPFLPIWYRKHSTGSIVMAKSSTRRRTSNHSTNGWDALRDILIASLNKGQFLFALIALIVIVLIYRIPQKDLSDLVDKILDLFKTLHYLGWVTSLILSFSWYQSSKMLRKAHSDEMTRVSKEKKELQENLLNKKLPSSNRQ